MKPGTGACWRSSCLWGIVLASLLALSACTGRVTGDGAVRLMQAQFASVAGTGFTPPPQRADDAQLPAGPWAAIALPHVQSRDLVPKAEADVLTATDWYRLDMPRLPPAPGQHYLYIPRWKTIGQIAVYGDGRLLYRSDSSFVHNGYNHPLLLRLDDTAEAGVPASVLIRIDRLRGSGSALSTVWAGDARTLVWRYQVREWLQTQLPYMSSAAFLAVGAFSLAAWLGRRRETLYLLFFVTSVVAYIRTLHYYVGIARLPVADDWFEWITIASLLWLVVLFHLFLQRLHKRPQRWLTAALLVLTTACSVVMLPVMSALPSVILTAPLFYLMLTPVAMLVFAYALRNAWQTRSREVWMMAAWIFASAACGLHDVSLQNNWIGPENMYVFPYAMIGLFYIFSHIMFTRYVGAIREVEQVNAGLAERLQARETELAQSYQRLRDVEQREMLSQERQRLMRDMHDGVGSSLAMAIHSVEHGSLDDTQVSSLLQDCMDDLKLAIDSMEPVEADLLLLLATLRFRLAARIESAGIRLSWQVQDLPALPWLEPASALHILRILQEAFANILRHAQATEIRVETGLAPDGGVLVAIEDNGRGFDPQAALHPGASHGRGLHNQQRRAQAIQGEVRWTSSPAGTRFTLWLPLCRAPQPVV
ncbi:sensor histidine kinase [Xylophilus sp. GW821-FHT01B05]